MKKILIATVAFIFYLSGSAENARLKKWIDGVYDIKYEYDRRDSDDFNTLFFSVKLEIEKNKIYTLIMVGLYSSDHSLITDLVIPKLQNIDAFQIKK